MAGRPDPEQGRKYDIDALLAAYDARLREQTHRTDRDLSDAQTIHSMFQRPAIKYIHEKANEGETDIAMVGTRLCVAHATALVTLLQQVEEDKRPILLQMMMSGIYADTMRLLSMLPSLGDEDKIVASDYYKPVN